jgi:UDP-N-acetylmuramoyl-tripeptide--D-alanyl-D-alanine ligase
LIPVHVDEVRAFCRGELRVADGARDVTGVQIDSRRVEPGDLFVAIGRGVEYHGEALARGAAAVLVPEDAFAALGAIGRAVRDRSSARVVAITGSTGKTSTKDILAALCRPLVATVAAEAGHNNEIGLPLTLTRIEPETEVVICEMGMRGIGQIAELCELARPHVGVITSIGPVHLELLGNVANVARAKAEVVAALPAGGTAIVPVRPRVLERFLTRHDVEFIRFGEGGDVYTERFEPPTLIVNVGAERVELEVPFRPQHQVENTLAALAAYHALDLPLARAAEGARDITFAPWRCEERTLPGDVLLINDAYNANPDSMAAALDYLRQRGGRRRRVAVLGEMAELGGHAEQYHREVSLANVDVLIAVGELARAYLGRAGEDHWVATVDEAAEKLRSLLREGDVVLIKGSRAVGLEGVAEALTPVTA